MRQHVTTGLSRLAALACLVLVAGFLAVSGSTAFAAHAPKAPTARAAAAKAKTVTMGSKLSPQDITVSPGTTVTWKSDDSGKHKVRSTSGPVELKSGDITSGQPWSFTFDTEGTYSYVDDEHKDDPQQHGTVTVKTGGSGGGNPGNPPEPPPPPPPPQASASLPHKTLSPPTHPRPLRGTLT